MAGRIIRFVMRAVQTTIGLIAMLVLPVAALAEHSLTPHSAEYRVRISVLGGVLKTTLRATATGYVATHVIKPTGFSRIIASGSISESSRFDIADDGIRPTQYSSDDTLSKEKIKAEIRFDWATGEARGIVNGKDVLSELDGLAYDRVSIQYELMHDLLNGEPGDQYTLFEIDKLKIVNVRNIGRKVVQVPAGEFEAIGIQHQSGNSSRITTLWCVDELDFLPVVIEQHRKGKLRVRATLQKYTPLET